MLKHKICMNWYPLKFYTLIFLALCIVFCSCWDKTKTLSFKGCQVTYSQYRGGEYKLYEGHYMTNEMQLEAAQRKLALCLCEQYSITKDTAVRNKIIELYNEKETYFTPSEEIINTNNIDSIIRYKKNLFDTTILID